MTILDLHELHEDWLVRKTKFQPLPAPVTVIDANPDLDMLSDKYRSLENHIFEQARAFKWKQDERWETQMEFDSHLSNGHANTKIKFYEIQKYH